MIKHFSKRNDSVHPANDGTLAPGQAEAGHEDACRCKETSQLTPQELIKLMMNDLAFWKKRDKG